LNLKNLKSFEDIFNFDQITIIEEKLDEIKDLYNEFNNSLLNHSENNFHNHPEIFFSLKEIKNIKIHKLLSIGKFGKVNIK